MPSPATVSPPAHAAAPGRPLFTGSFDPPPRTLPPPPFARDPPPPGNPVRRAGDRALRSRPMATTPSPALDAGPFALAERAAAQLAERSGAGNHDVAVV